VREYVVYHAFWGVGPIVPWFAEVVVVVMMHTDRIVLAKIGEIVLAKIRLRDLQHRNQVHI